MTTHLERSSGSKPGDIHTGVGAERKPRIAWFAFARSPYNDFMFKTLAETFDITVVYTHKDLATHPWRFSAHPVPVHYVRDELFPCIRLGRTADAIVMSGWHDWRYLLLMELLPSRIPKAFWTDTPRTNSLGAIWKDKLRTRIANRVFTKFDEVWATGLPGCEALRVLGCPEAKIRSLPFFYDLNRYESVIEDRRQEAKRFRERHTDSCASDVVVFLAAGQFVSSKGFADAIAALARDPRRRAFLWLCGAGPEEKALRDQTEQLGLRERVRFLGWLQPGELELAFLAADVFVHPAARDPFPTVVLDAMTWGKPVVGTKTSGSVVDRVVHGQNGFVYEAGDIDALWSHMAFFLEGRERIRSFHTQSRAKAVQYPVELAVSRLRNLLRLRCSGYE